MNFNSIDEIINTTENMEMLRNNVKQDDGTDTVAGADWFKFNGVPAENLYASGNCWVGIGSNTENLKVCRRDGAMYYLYRQEGTLYHYYHFVKMRWEGTTNYNSTAETYSLKFEFFIFESGDMFLNVIKSPTSASYLGESRLVCGSTSISLTVTAGNPQMITFMHQDETGTAWEVAYEKINILPPFDRKYLLEDKAGIFYTITDGKATEIPVDVIGAQVFREYGSDAPPVSTVLVGLQNPKILYWQDSDSILPERGATVTAVPPPQTVWTTEQSMSDPTIAGIESVAVEAIGNPLFAFSFGGGAWEVYGGGAWKDAGNDGMTKSEVEAVTAEQWADGLGTARTYEVKFKLAEEDVVNSITVKYKNQEGVQ